MHYAFTFLLSIISFVLYNQGLENSYFILTTPLFERVIASFFLGGSVYFIIKYINRYLYTYINKLSLLCFILAIVLMYLVNKKLSDVNSVYNIFINNESDNSRNDKRRC